MSRILRRPMFRGGPVDSRGTGITANLGYNNGGRVGYKDRGFVVQPPSVSGLFSIQDILKQTGAPMTGKQILEFAKDKQLNLGRDFKINPYSKYIPENVEVQVGEDTVEKPFGEIIREKGFQFYEDPNEEYLGKGDSQGEIGDKSEDGGREFTSNFGTTNEVAEKLKSKEIKNNLLSDDTILNSQNTANEELTIEEIKDTLGYKKAFRRDLGDTLGRAAASFLGAPSLTEGAQKFFEAESKSGPGRAEKIETAAATFMLKDKAQSKRDKANIELMKSKIDYQIEAGEDISLPKALLAANKSGMLNNKELSVGIQSATSPTTGKNFNFKKVVTLEEFKNLKDLQPGDTFVVTAKTKDSATGADKITKSIIEIDLQGNPQKIYNIA
jgi:hypothetical protein|tara:strand:- start:2745 stop:3896 length:1152 start_codon:yes stop_codon:yes gene_type:complete